MTVFLFSNHVRSSRKEISQEGCVLREAQPVSSLRSCPVGGSSKCWSGRVTHSFYEDIEYVFPSFNVLLQLFRLCESYTKVLVVLADNVGSRQMAEIRLALREKGVLLMGKNTMICTALRKMTATIPRLEKLIPCIKQNIGLIFCGEDPASVRKIVLENKVPAPARQGVLAPCRVVIPGGCTGLDPSQTSFFQALGISTKIVKGQIEIQSDVNLIETGDKVTASQCALLQKLNIMPFTYGLVAQQIYDDGSVYDSSVLDITNEDIIRKFDAGVCNIAALSLEIGMPNQVSVVHSIVRGFKYVMASVLESDFSFPEMERVKEVIIIRYFSTIT